MNDTIVAWTYEASIHCPDCAYERFGNDLHKPTTVDREGNKLHPVFLHEEWQIEGDCCSDCKERWD
jgi:hypothetical protein